MALLKIFSMRLSTSKHLEISVRDMLLSCRYGGLFSARNRGKFEVSWSR